MIPKLLGAVLILGGCGGFGMLICITYKREEEMLRQLILGLDYMQCELRFRMTPLPELCRQAADTCKGQISQLFRFLSDTLNCRMNTDVSQCVADAQESAGPFPPTVSHAIGMLHVSMGQFDAQGQIESLESVLNYCRLQLKTMEENRDMRLRSYQTLGICAGAALVILLV